MSSYYETEAVRERWQDCPEEDCGHLTTIHLNGWCCVCFAEGRTNKCATSFEVGRPR